MDHVRSTKGNPEKEHDHDISSENRPLFSIIMPTYNSVRFLDPAIESILSQTITDFELIVIDDASADNTRDLIKSYNDKRIKVVYNDENMGVSYTRNRGMEMANGKYLIFMDHDDLLPNNRLELHYQAFLKSNDIVAFGGKIANIDENDRFINYHNEEVEKDPIVLAGRIHTVNPFINGAVTYLTDFIKNNGIRFWENSYGLEDYAFLLTVTKYGRISAIDDLVLSYRRHGSNTEKQILRTQFEQRKRKWQDVFRYAFSADGIELSDRDIHYLCEFYIEKNTEDLSLKEMGQLMIVLENVRTKLDTVEDFYRSGLQIWIREQIQIIKDLLECYDLLY